MGTESISNWVNFSRIERCVQSTSSGKKKRTPRTRTFCYMQVILHCKIKTLFKNPGPDFPGRLDTAERTECLKKSLEKIPQREKKGSPGEMA